MIVETLSCRKICGVTIYKGRISPPLKFTAI